MAVSHTLWDDQEYLSEDEKIDVLVSLKITGSGSPRSQWGKMGM